MTNRSRKLTDLAHELQCMFTDLPHVCTWPRTPCVPCHANWQIFDRGFAFKVPDHFFAAGCTEAHDLVDGRRGGMDLEARLWAWWRAHVRTMAEVWRRGWLVVTR